MYPHEAYCHGEGLLQLNTLAICSFFAGTEYGSIGLLCILEFRHQRARVDAWVNLSIDPIFIQLGCAGIAPYKSIAFLIHFRMY